MYCILEYDIEAISFCALICTYAVLYGLINDTVLSIALLVVFPHSRQWATSSATVVRTIVTLAPAER